MAETTSYPVLRKLSKLFIGLSILTATFPVVMFLQLFGLDPRYYTWERNSYELLLYFAGFWFVVSAVMLLISKAIPLFIHIDENLSELLNK